MAMKSAVKIWKYTAEEKLDLSQGYMKSVENEPGVNVWNLGGLVSKYTDDGLSFESDEKGIKMKISFNVSIGNVLAGMWTLYLFVCTLFQSYNHKTINILVGNMTLKVVSLSNNGIHVRNAYAIYGEHNIEAFKDISAEVNFKYIYDHCKVYDKTTKIKVVKECNNPEWTFIGIVVTEAESDVKVHLNINTAGEGNANGETRKIMFTLRK